MRDQESAIPDRSSPSVWQGLIAGVIGGTIVAVFFFVLDAGRGEPFQTPGYLAEAVFGDGGVRPWFNMIAAFTILHYVVFAAIGAGAVMLFRWAGLPQNLLLGALYGLFVCSIIFYLSLIVRGPEVLPAAWWSEVLIGNLLAGIGMGAYLYRATPSTGTGPGILGVRAHSAIREGVWAGLIGAVAVAAWFLVVDVVAREPLFTPAALGSALLTGARSAADVRVTVGTVLGYSAIHLSAFLLFGVVLAGLVAQAEKFPPLIWALVLLLVVFEVFFVGMVALLGVWILDEIAWWSVLVGNLLAAAGMGGYLWKAHPVLGEEVRAGKIWAAGPGATEPER